MIHHRFRFFHAMAAYVFCFGFWASGAPISPESALDRARPWMEGNPVMASVADRTVSSVTIFSDSGGNSVYVASFSPSGYLVLNSDDRLPLVVSFSADSAVDLSDDPQNAFRAMLLDYCERMAEALSQPAILLRAVAAEYEPLAETELHGPFLETTWSQSNPYNKLCPDDPGGSQYNGYRAPSGCTPTAYAQVMQFHRWPLRGTGSHSYTDGSGSITGLHSAVFSDEYDWASMLGSYNAWSANPAAAEAAVAELMYELGVAAEANYESDGTSSSVSTLGGRLVQFLHYESLDYHSDQSSLIASMEADLRAGFPCVVAIPGHAVVADGLMVDGGTTTYHINYGWGGTNNGWWSASGIPGGALEYGTTSLRPKLLAFPLTNAVSGELGNPVELDWILPKRRTAEVAQLEIRQLVQQTGSWQSAAGEITGLNAGWEVVSAGRSGDCWFTGPNHYSSHLLGEVFVPDASSRLTFWQFAQLYVSRFSVEVSADGGESYDSLYSTPSDICEYNWSKHTISLADYAGQQIRVRFVLSESGGYYNTDWAGVRIDDLAITSETWYDWQPFAVDAAMAVRDPGEVAPGLEGQPVYYTMLTNLSTGTYTLAAALVDTNGVEHGLAPSFVLSVAAPVDDGDGMPTAWEEQYGLDPAIHDGDLDPDNDGYTNYEEYICGTDPTNAASRWLLETGDDSLPVFHGAADRLYAILYCTNLVDGAWEPLATDIPGTNGPIALGGYDSATNAGRFYRVQVWLND